VNDVCGDDDGGQGNGHGTSFVRVDAVERGERRELRRPQDEPRGTLKQFKMVRILSLDLRITS
jgi:hypothetical protein